jgi:hypothetical protein
MMAAPVDDEKGDAMTDAALLPAPIEQFLAAVPDPGSAAALRALCEVIVSAEPRLVGEIKWNAPSFTLEGRDVVTTGVNRDGSIRLVLHRGAAKAAPGAQRPEIDDPAGLLEWRGVDRAISTFPDEAFVRASAQATRDLVRQWVATGASGTA